MSANELFKLDDYFGGKKTFDEEQKKDKIKKEYCHNNSVKLIEVIYNENINEKLKCLLNIK